MFNYVDTELKGLSDTVLTLAADPKSKQVGTGFLSLVFVAVFNRLMH